MTDTRLDLARQYERLSGPLADGGVGISLGVWAGRGDWASCSQEHRDEAGGSALTALDAQIAKLTEFRERLAAAVPDQPAPA